MRLKISILLLHWLLFQISTVAFANHVDTVRIRKDLLKITKTPHPWQFQHLASLNLVADYIKQEFSKSSEAATKQKYQVNGQEYRNIICSFKPGNKPRLIIEAHYDVCGDQPGADDNASGVAGLLELSRLLPQENLKFRIDLVAFTLKEPPFFRTEHIGSFVHAQSLKMQHIPVLGMISSEMIGYFSDQKQSQKYPFKPFKLICGSTGDYITLVEKYQKGKLFWKFNRSFRDLALLPVTTFKAPDIIPGIDFSNQRNYRLMGYSALIITDTSFYRNPNYHLPSDTIGTQKLITMSAVVESVCMAFVSLNSG